MRVAVLATAGFSPFHFSVPCIPSGSALPQQGLFHVDICAEKPGPVISELGLSIMVYKGPEPLDKADIIIVPYWHNPAEKPAPALLLTRHFHKATGMSLGEWLTVERLQRSQVLLETTGISIEGVAEKAGFDSPVCCFSWRVAPDVS